MGLKAVGDAELWSGIRPVDGAGPDQGERPGGGGGVGVARHRSRASLGDTGRFAPHRHSAGTGLGAEPGATGGSLRAVSALRRPRRGRRRDAAPT